MHLHVVQLWDTPSFLNLFDELSLCVYVCMTVHIHISKGLKNEGYVIGTVLNAPESKHILIMPGLSTYPLVILLFGY